MTVVVADTSPLNYLILIDAVDVLPQLYGSVVVPRQVIAELTAAEAPGRVRTWASVLPAWIDARDAAVGEEDMKHLDLGERAAILLAESQPDALLLIDETDKADVEIEGLLRTMFDARNNLAVQVSDQLVEHFGDKVYRTIVPRNVRLAEAPSHGLPVFKYDKTSRGAVAYLALAGELVRREQERAQAVAAVN